MEGLCVGRHEGAVRAIHLMFLPPAPVLVPACRAGFDPRQRIAHRLRLDATAESPDLPTVLMNYATSVCPPAELATIGASDRHSSGSAWPNAAKQAHNFATHLPAAMAEYERHKAALP